MMQRIKAKLEEIFSPADPYRSNYVAAKPTTKLEGNEKALCDFSRELFELINEHTKNRSWLSGSPVSVRYDNNLLALQFGLGKPTRYTANAEKFRRLTCKGCNRPAEDFSTIDALKNDVHSVIAGSQRVSSLGCPCYGVLSSSDPD
jgi:hypothetical protein